jgi:hypothetical protein
MQFQNAARRTVGAHEHIARHNVFHQLCGTIEHQDGRTRRMAAGRGDTEGVAVFAERADATLDELLLAGAEQHGVPLTAPRTGARPPSVLKIGASRTG